MKSHEHELFETETMAELCARQDRPHEAIAIYQRLMDCYPNSDRYRLWATRLDGLAATWGQSSASEATPSDVPLPEVPGVRVWTSEDHVTVAWAVSPAALQARLELFLVHKTSSGVETTTRQMPLTAPGGRVAFRVPGLHKAIAAVGHARGERFVPFARSGI